MNTNNKQENFNNDISEENGNCSNVLPDNNLTNYLSFSESVQFPTAHRSTKLQTCHRTPFNFITTSFPKTSSFVGFDFATPASKIFTPTISRAKRTEFRPTDPAQQTESFLSIIQNPNFGASSVRALRTNYENKFSVTFGRTAEVQIASTDQDNAINSLKQSRNR